MATEISPRVENGVLKWYEGDAFFVRFGLVINKQTGEELVIGESDKVVVTFYDSYCRKIVAIDVPVSNGKTLPVHIDSRRSKLFPVGNYHYDVELHRNNSETIQTIAHCCKVEVEGCKCRQ